MGESGVCGHRAKEFCRCVGMSVISDVCSAFWYRLLSSGIQVKNYSSLLTISLYFQDSF